MIMIQIDLSSDRNREAERNISSMCTLINTVLVTTLALFVQNSVAEKCLAGPFHRNNSAPGGANFVECLKYKDNACCTAALTKTIRDKPEMLYNFTWHHCKDVSQKCLQYLRNEECFYQCEPTLIRYKRANRSDVVQNVPICSSYCDKWFEACKDDQTCVENWETDFVIIGKTYACPLSSKCRTYREVYKNGTGLCNKMWGVSFSYQKTSASCYTMGPHSGPRGNAKMMQPMLPLSVVAWFVAAFMVSDKQFF